MKQSVNSQSQNSVEALFGALNGAHRLGAKWLLRAFSTGIATELGATVTVSITRTVLRTLLNTVGFFQPCKDISKELIIVLEMPAHHKK